MMIISAEKCDHTDFDHIKMASTMMMTVTLNPMMMIVTMGCEG
jgi:hypothetical protein